MAERPRFERAMQLAEDELAAANEDGARARVAARLGERNARRRPRWTMAVAAAALASLATWWVMRADGEPAISPDPPPVAAAAHPTPVATSAPSPTAVGPPVAVTIGRPEPPPDEEPGAFPEVPVFPNDDEETGTLVAIAIGGTCLFAVDGRVHGERSSIRTTVTVGQHLVTCARPNEPLRRETVTVSKDKPGIAAFRL